MSKIGDPDPSRIQSVESAPTTIKSRRNLWYYSSDRVKPYDMHEIIKHLVDHSEFEEYKDCMVSQLFVG